jgi:hypothetical protein
MNIISHILIVGMIHLCWLTSYGWAEMVNGVDKVLLFNKYTR